MATKRKKKPGAQEETAIILRPQAGKIVPILSEGDESTADTIALLTQTLGRRKNRTQQVLTMDKLTHATIPLEPFGLQYLFQNVYMRQHAVLEIIGQPAVGKTTLSLMLAGAMMRHLQAPVLYMHADAKSPDSERVMRCLSSVTLEAHRMLQQVSTVHVHSQRQMWETLREWVMTCRGHHNAGKRSVHYPINQPLVAIVDPFGRLLSDDEAEGTQLYADFMDPKKKRKELMDGSNFTHAKFAQRFGRQLGELQESQNVFLIVVSNQNDEVDFGAKVGMALPETYRELRNDTKLGGRALGQIAAYQLIMVPVGSLKNRNGDVIGKTVRCRMHKNSFGCQNRDIDIDIKEITDMDMPGYMEPPLQFTRGMIDRFITQGLLEGVTQDNQDTYTWAAQELYDQPSSVIFWALATKTPDTLRQIGRHYKIKGYYDPVAEAVEAARAAAPAK